MGSKWHNQGYYDCDNGQQDEGLADADLVVAGQVGRDGSYHVDGAAEHHMAASAKDGAIFRAFAASGGSGKSCDLCHLVYLVRIVILNLLI